jgi:5' nucleotidase family
LYIGDHIYGDILRLRKQHMWRTAMIIQELDREISVSDRLETQLRDLDLLDRRRRNLESEIDFQSLRLKRVQRLLEDAQVLHAAQLIDPGLPPMAALAAGASMSTRAIGADDLRGLEMAPSPYDVSHAVATRLPSAVAGAYGLPAPAPGMPAVTVDEPEGDRTGRGATLPAVAADLVPRLEQLKRQIRDGLDRLRDRARLMTEECEALEDGSERAFNPYWGSVLREGNENSRFGEQVGDYADLYTSRVSNFLSYSPLRYFRAPRRAMPHEL